jgi:hypothetical protein
MMVRGANQKVQAADRCCLQLRTPKYEVGWQQALWDGRWSHKRRHVDDTLALSGMALTERARSGGIFVLRRQHRCQPADRYTVSRAHGRAVGASVMVR